MIKARFPIWLFVLFLLAIIMRLMFALFFFGNYDQASYQIVTHIARMGENVYTLTDRYNYSPIWFHILVGLDYVREATHIPLHSLIRSLISWIDLVNAALIGLIAYHLYPKQSKFIAVGYALSLGAILIAGLHGQFEALALLPILVAVYGRVRWRWKFWHVLPLFILGIVIKQNSIVVVWALLAAWYGYRRAVLGCLAALALFLMTLLPYVTPENGLGILQNVLIYTGVDERFGFAGLVPRVFTLALMGLGFLITPWLFRNRGWPVVVVASLLIWFASGTFAIQYLTYLLVFAAFLPRYRLLLMIVSIFIALMEISYNGVVGTGLADFLPIIRIIMWGLFAFWFIDLLLIQIRQRHDKYSSQNLRQTLNVSANDQTNQQTSY